MKSQFPTQPAILSQPQNIINNEKILQKLQKIACINNVKAHYVCINSTCGYENAIMCSNLKCSCRMMHQYCIRAEIESIIMAIQAHARPLKQFQQKINDIFQIAIDKLSVIRDNLIEMHRQLFDQKSYSKKQSIFLSMLDSNCIQQLKGTFMSQITSKINHREEINKIIISSDEELEKISTKIMKDISSFNSQVERILMQLQRNFSNPKSEMNLAIRQPYLFETSQIITTIDQQNILRTFLQGNILESTLLYRASQHKFSGEMFHMLCEDIPNILVLIKTQHDKLIGGYTPLAFSSTQRDVYLKDPEQKSFLFSLTEGDKLSLKTPQNAIMNQRHSQYVLRFGGGSDLRISNHADQNVLSYAAISTSYCNQKYTNSIEGYRKFTGSDSIYFKINEWEVWKIVFQ